MYYNVNATPFPVPIDNDNGIKKKKKTENMTNFSQLFELLGLHDNGQNEKWT